MTQIDNNGNYFTADILPVIKYKVLEFDVLVLDAVLMQIGESSRKTFKCFIRKLL